MDIIIIIVVGTASVSHRCFKPQFTRLLIFETRAHQKRSVCCKTFLASVMVYGGAKIEHHSLCRVKANGRESNPGCRWTYGCAERPRFRVGLQRSFKNLTTEAGGSFQMCYGELSQVRALQRERQSDNRTSNFVSVSCSPESFDCCLAKRFVPYKH